MFITDQIRLLKCTFWFNKSCYLFLNSEHFVRVFFLRLMKVIRKLLSKVSIILGVTYVRLLISCVTYVNCNSPCLFLRRMYIYATVVHDR